MRQVVTVLPRTGRLKGRNTIPTCRDLAGIAQWATLRCRFQVPLADGHMHAAADQPRITHAPFALSDLKFACSAPAAQHPRRQTSKMFAALSPPTAPPSPCAPSENPRCVCKYCNSTSSSQLVLPPKRGVCSKGPLRLENHCG